MRKQKVVCKICLPASQSPFLFFFFFNDTATTEIYTLSLHDALPICGGADPSPAGLHGAALHLCRWRSHRCQRDRKSTRLNSSHLVISYAVFCLKKKNTKLLPLSIVFSSSYSFYHMSPERQDPFIFLI